MPILHDLLAEVDAGTFDQPGVRALLLYPMNALANDQLRRLREVLAPYPQLTYGRYVGDTEDKAKPALDQFRLPVGGVTPLPNELLVSRRR
jgi:ATP-dependent helicase YprA (DUF1998 family)